MFNFQMWWHTFKLVGNSKSTGSSHEFTMPNSLSGALQSITNHLCTHWLEWTVIILLFPILPYFLWVDKHTYMYTLIPSWTAALQSSTITDPMPHFSSKIKQGLCLFNGVYRQLIVVWHRQHHTIMSLFFQTDARKPKHRWKYMASWKNKPESFLSIYKRWGYLQPETQEGQIYCQFLLHRWRRS